MTDNVCGASTGDGECQLVAGWGTDHVGEGRCKHHGGAGGAVGDSGGAPEGNTNAVSHGLFVERNRFYQEVIDDDLRQLCDEIFEGYVEKFRQVNGEPLAGDKARLSEIAVNHIKIIHSDNWAVAKPAELETGSGFVDRETRVKTTEHDTYEEHRYTESVVIKTQQRLRKEDRKWLKEYNLLGPDEVNVNVDGKLDHDHDHDHEHGLDEETQQIIDDLGEEFRA